MGNFNNPEADLDRFRFRLGSAAAFVLLCFGILIGRFVWLQVRTPRKRHTRLWHILNLTRRSAPM